jgi:hypothetical protein
VSPVPLPAADHPQPLLPHMGYFNNDPTLFLPKRVVYPLFWDIVVHVWCIRTSHAPSILSIPFPNKSAHFLTLSLFWGHRDIIYIIIYIIKRYIDIDVVMCVVKKVLAIFDVLCPVLDIFLGF